jgi:hypothetical protein
MPVMVPVVAAEPSANVLPVPEPPLTCPVVTAPGNSRNRLLFALLEIATAIAPEIVALLVTVLGVAPSKNTPNFTPEIFAAVVAFGTEPPPDRNTPEPLLPEMVPARTLSLNRPFP